MTRGDCSSIRLSTPVGYAIQRSSWSAPGCEHRLEHHPADERRVERRVKDFAYQIFVLVGYDHDQVVNTLLRTRAPARRLMSRNLDRADDGVRALSVVLQVYLDAPVVFADKRCELSVAREAYAVGVEQQRVTAAPRYGVGSRRSADDGRLPPLIITTSSLPPSRSIAVSTARTTPSTAYSGFVLARLRIACGARQIALRRYVEQEDAGVLQVVRAESVLVACGHGQCRWCRG